MKSIKFLSIALILLTACAAKNAKVEAQDQNSKTEMTENAAADTGSAKVLLETSEGPITVLLYGDTPLHRDNFLKLVRDSVYNGTLFHRVINEFMVQAGDPDSKNAQPGQRLGAGDLGYTIPAEIVYPKHFHKRGALAAARQGDQVNPERRSSGSQFYIVTGSKLSEAQAAQLAAMQHQQKLQATFQTLAMQHQDEIEKLQRDNDRQGLENLRQELIKQTEAQVGTEPAPLPDDIRQAYTTVGGAPHLDGQYTVFGEVISGMDVVDKIEKAETDAADRPLSDIRIISAKVID